MYLRYRLQGAQKIQHVLREWNPHIKVKRKIPPKVRLKILSFPYVCECLNNISKIKIDRFYLNTLLPMTFQSYVKIKLHNSLKRFFNNLKQIQHSTTFLYVYTQRIMNKTKLPYNNTLSLALLAGLSNMMPQKRSFLVMLQVFQQLSFLNL